MCLIRQLAGSMWARSRRGLDGRCWAEVYCGSAESGSWVHVDPLTGTVDRSATPHLFPSLAAPVILHVSHLIQSFARGAMHSDGERASSTE